MKGFLTSPCPRAAGVVQCYIRRNKAGTAKLFPEYHVYLADGDKFLMCSKRRPNNKTSNYIISMRAGDLNRGSPNYLGKLRANFIGTEFQIFDHGANPRDLLAGNFGHPEQARSELGVVLYASNVLGSRGPRKMQVAIPKIREDGTPLALAKGTGAGAKGTMPEEDMMMHLKNHNCETLCYLINKPPRWNDQVSAYVLNFNGRVTMASVKNFQLVTPDDHETVVLQFGRVAKDEFTMDFQWPITPLQAFAITLSSFDSKIACD
ncbi:hypothetical protein JKP88DRAFT_257776 [Tribonema minus]|uniref:Tubby C-terminal domain-containing protein n=1 Tax=Tribonema minus TaxID=303371 RepID=A0A835YWG7_9STRA|nr:hypothetical protein JKP88DRAFT_257776 [Tribonema minus]